MKRLFIFLFAIITLFSCSSPEPTHEVRYSENGKDSVVYVQYRDENGNQSNFFMNYLLFRTLFDQGGYNNVYHHYSSSPMSYNNSGLYNGYRSRNTTTFDVQTPSRPSSSPSRSSGFRTYKSSSSPSRSYSSPSRSYSSPSRSYSSPSRSYSSPSRSFSSPSRSFSSPSRGH